MGHAGQRHLHPRSDAEGGVLSAVGVGGADELVAAGARPNPNPDPSTGAGGGGGGGEERVIIGGARPGAVDPGGASWVSYIPKHYSITECAILFVIGLTIWRNLFN